MQIDFFCPIWGSEQLPLDEFLRRVKSDGYAGVEMNIPFDEAYGDRLRDGLARYGLKLICQQYLAPEGESPAAYERRLTGYLTHLADFEPVLLNSHTGRDHFSFDDNCRLIEAAEAVARERGVKLVHETHRGRFSFSAFATRAYLKRFAGLRLTADFSHWCCVSESYLEDQRESVSLAIDRADYLHARIGHDQGSQVTHPGAPEVATAREAHLAWWDRIVENQRVSGTRTFNICCEFGPVPYLPVVPFTGVPLASQWDNNLYVKRLLSERYLT